VSAIWWFVLVGVVVVLLATGAVLALRRRDGGSEHVLDAQPRPVHTASRRTVRWPLWSSTP
jgi:hypothetical protein